MLHFNMFFYGVKLLHGVLFFFFAKDHGLWNLSSPTTDETKGPVSERAES